MNIILPNRSKIAFKPPPPFPKEPYIKLPDTYDPKGSFGFPHDPFEELKEKGIKEKNSFINLLCLIK